MHPTECACVILFTFKVTTLGVFLFIGCTNQRINVSHLLLVIQYGGLKAIRSLLAEYKLCHKHFQASHLLVYVVKCITSRDATSDDVDLSFSIN